MHIRNDHSCNGESTRDLRLARSLGVYANLDNPLGFCLGVNDHALVTDTDNHRVVAFIIATGQFDFSFGSHGVENGQFVRPRKITMIPQTVLSVSNDNPAYVVCDRGTDRSRLQMFTPGGVFIRSIRLPAVEIVSGLTGTQDRKIVLVDSIRCDVLVLSEFGDILFVFNTAAHLREPGDIAIHHRDYYLCDFQGHSIAVFDSTGELRRKIGADVLHYPNGIDISNRGDILVADSHFSQFHLNVFRAKSGRRIGAFRFSSFKVTGVVGLKFTTSGEVLSLSKNNRRVLVFEPVQIVVEDGGEEDEEEVVEEGEEEEEEDED